MEDDLDEVTAVVSKVVRNIKQARSMASSLGKASLKDFGIDPSSWEDL